MLAAALAPRAGVQASSEAASASETAGVEDGGSVLVQATTPLASADASGSGASGGFSDGGQPEGKGSAGARVRSTYYVNGAPAPLRAQSAESLSLDAARVTWTEVLSEAVLPATMAVDMTRKAKDVDARDLRFALYAYEQGWRVDGDGQLEALV